MKLVKNEITLPDPSCLSHKHAHKSTSYIIHHTS